MKIYYKVVKAKIPFQGLMDEIDNYHVYEEFLDGTSKLLGVFKYKKHAEHFKNYLEIPKIKK